MIDGDKVAEADGNAANGSAAVEKNSAVMQLTSDMDSGADYTIRCE